MIASPSSDTKLCDMPTISEDGPAALWRDASGRLSIRIATECGYAEVAVDLTAVIEWVLSPALIAALRVR